MKEIYREELRLTHWWFRVIPVLIIALATVITVMQLGFGIQVGDKPLPNDKIWTIWLASGVVFWLFRSIRLETVINDTGIHVRFFPFSRQFYPWDDIRTITFGKYNPLLDPNNYGVRFLMRSKTYNVQGQYAMELLMKDGRRIVIGTNRPEALDRLLGDELGEFSRQ